MASYKYIPLVNEARKKVIAISREEKRQIKAMYLEVAQSLEKDLKGKDGTTLTYRWLKDYAKALKKDSERLFEKQGRIIRQGIEESAFVTAEAQRRYFASLAPRLSEQFTDVFSRAYQSAVDELVSGKMYDNFAGLSTRLWNYQEKFNRDIGYIINEGIIAKKPAYDLAKDLEIYLNQKAKKPFDWGKVYPHSNKVVDYSAQRLARTSCTHAYQLSLERSTQDNPFVEEYQWLSSNSHSRICDLCAQRNGKYYKKGHVPLDHPNGMCTIIPVIRKGYNEIGRELADWANGEENEGLDNWLLKGFSNEAKAYSRVMRQSDVMNRSVAGMVMKSGNDGKKPLTSGYERGNISSYLNQVSATGANRFTQGFSEDNLAEHWYGSHSHMDQYPEFSMEQYAERALELIQSPTDARILGYKNAKGQITRYDTVTNDFVKGRPDLGIATMFKPTAGIRYYEAWKKKEGI